jgi:hypothetical protein
VTSAHDAGAASIADGNKLPVRAWDPGPISISISISSTSHHATALAALLEGLAAVGIRPGVAVRALKDAETALRRLQECRRKMNLESIAANALGVIAKEAEAGKASNVSTTQDCGITSPEVGASFLLSPNRLLVAARAEGAAVCYRQHPGYKIVVNKDHNDNLIALTNMKTNLDALIQNPAWDKP